MHGMDVGGRQQAQAFIWPAPIPTRPLSADDAETHMDPPPIYVSISRLPLACYCYGMVWNLSMDLQSSQS